MSDPTLNYRLHELMIAVTQLTHEIKRFNDAAAEHPRLETDVLKPEDETRMRLENPQQIQ